MSKKCHIQKPTENNDNYMVFVDEDGVLELAFD